MTGALRAFPGVTCPAMSAPPPRPGRRSGPPGRGGRPRPSVRLASRAATYAGRRGCPGPGDDRCRRPRRRRRSARARPRQSRPDRPIPRRAALARRARSRAGRVPRPRVAAPRRPVPRGPGRTVARAAVRTSRGAGGSPRRRIATTPVRAAPGARRESREPRRVPARSRPPRGGAAATRAGAPDANRPPRPSGERPRSGAGGHRGHPATRRSSRPGSRDARSRHGSTRDRCAPRRSPRPDGRPAIRRPAPVARQRRARSCRGSRRSARQPAAVRPSSLKRLASASEALDRERFDEAHRMVAPLIRQFPGVAAVHELAGLASYRVRPVEPGDHRARGGAGHHSVGRPAAGAGRLLPGAAAMGRRRGHLAGGARGVAGARDRRRGAHRRRRVARRSG